MSSVDYSDLDMAMEFVSSAEVIDSRAYISRDTGEIYWESAEGNLEEEIPDDVDDHDRYAFVPDKRDLDLGKRLVLRFASEALPDRYEEIQAIFRRPGAYARYKDLLFENELLDAWYEFEQSATKSALIEWAESQGFTVEIAPDKPAP